MYFHVNFQKLAMSSDVHHWLGRKRLTTLPIKYHQTLACSLFSPHATLLLFPFFSVKLTKSFFLDLRMFLKAATLVASLDKGKKMEVQKDKVMWLQYDSMCYCWR